MVLRVQKEKKVSICQASKALSNLFNVCVSMCVCARMHINTHLLKFKQLTISRRQKPFFFHYSISRSQHRTWCVTYVGMSGRTLMFSCWSRQALNHQGIDQVGISTSASQIWKAKIVLFLFSIRSLGEFGLSDRHSAVNVDT